MIRLSFDFDPNFRANVEAMISRFSARDVVFAEFGGAHNVILTLPGKHLSDFAIWYNA